MGDRDRPMDSFVSKYDAIYVQPDYPIEKKVDIARFLVPMPLLSNSQRGGNLFS